MTRKLAMLAAVELLVATSAGAVQISFQSRNDATYGTTSAFTSTGDFVQFDPAGDNSSSLVAQCLTGSNFSDSSGDVSSTQVPGTDHRGYSLAPQGGTGCYYNVGTNGFDEQVSGNTDVFEASDFANLGPAGYYGFLWGSPDSYNTLQFVGAPDANYQNASVVASSNFFGGLDTNHDGILTGLEAYRGIDPSATSLTGDNAQSFYINFVFDSSEIVYGLRLGSIGNCCFEFDNVASDPGTVTAPSVASPLNRFAEAATVPEPASVALFGLATLAFAMCRQRPTRTLPR